MAYIKTTEMRPSAHRREWILCNNVFVPSPRPLVSGRDFQVRYALWRLVRMAKNADPPADAARIRIEWPLNVSKKGHSIWCDVVIEREDGRALEIIECKEHADYLDPESLEQFLEHLAAFGSTRSLRGASVRLVSTARFLADGTNMANSSQRHRALRQIDASRADLAFEEGVHFDFDTPAKEALTALTVFELTGLVDEPKEVYSRFYARAMAQMAKRHGDDGDRFIRWIRDIHLELFRDIRERSFEEILARSADGDSIDVAELRSLLSGQKPPASTIAAEKIYGALRRDLFGEVPVTLEEIFIEPTASIETAAESRTALRTGPALAILFDWLSDLRTGRVKRAPMVLLGGFGSGKSSLLTTFAASLLGSDVIPLLVPLRDLITATDRSFDLAIKKYIEKQWNARLSDAPGIRYCLLCDGFDELNLYYARSDQREWVEMCYASVVLLAQTFNAAVIISSRPILLMSSGPAFLSPSARVRLHEFSSDDIRAWCAKYQAAAKLSRRFSWQFLASRNLDGVSSTPIVLYMIARIFETAPELLQKKEYNRADVYQLFIDWTERGGYAHDEVKHRLPENYRQILQDLAWVLFQSRDGMLSEDELVDKLRMRWGKAARDGVRIDRNLLVAHMLQPVGDRKERLIEFTHQSFCDYLVAEKIWRQLEPARNGESLSPATWVSLQGNVPTAATIRFLADIIDRVDAKEARALYNSLDRTDNVHAYWNEWLLPVWDALGNDRSREALQCAVSSVSTTASHACAMATLGFLLRMRAYRRLVALRSTTGIVVSAARNLMQLQHLQFSLRESSLAASSRSLLLESLSGLRVEAEGSMEGFIAGVAAWNDVVARQVNFGRALFRQTMFSQCDFAYGSFANAIFVPRTAHDVHFTGASFLHAHIDFLNEMPEAYTQLDFTGADFRGSYFNAIRVSEGTFVKNQFANAYCGAGPHRLVRCKLDRQATKFFQAAGVDLVDCT